METKVKSGVCIVSTVNLMHMTISSLYTDFFKENNINFDIIYIDKYGIDEKSDAKNKYQFCVKNRKSKFGKIINVLKFTRYVKKVIKRNKYEVLIIWNELTSLLLGKFLSTQYKNRYIVNIRDYGYNDLAFIKSRTKKVIENSYFTMISSDKFKDFLPYSNKYIFTHSYNQRVFHNFDFIYQKKKKDEPIVILFIGKMSYLNSSKSFIKYLANDDRFLLKFVGAGTEILKDYVGQKHITNIEIEGSFSPDQTAQYLKNADIIFNLYGFGSKDVDTGLSIKLYYAIHLNIPILTYDDTYINYYAKKSGINITISRIMTDDLSDYIYNSYHNWDIDLAMKLCNKTMIEIENSQIKLHSKLKELLSS